LEKEVEEKEDLGKGIKLEMVLIPAGKFMMGSPASEMERRVDETPLEVTLTKPYFMGKYEVTQEQWKAVMGNNPSSRIKGAKLPVTDVSWEDCQEFIKKLNAKTDGGYRLPTEAEWEYACRAGTTTAYAFGGHIRKSDANFDNADLSTKVVGSYKPNKFGLYDMQGNVWEWCEDWYGDYSSGSITDPKGPATGTSRVLRGGSFINYGSSARSACRNHYMPSNPDYGNRGFRLTRTAETKAILEPTVFKPDPVEEMPALGKLLVAPFTEATAMEAQKEVAKSLQKEVEGKDDLSNGIKLEMVLIPAGKFTMGSPANEKGRYDNETQHEITLTKPFYMGKYAVTQEQWEAVMGNNPSSRTKGVKLPVTDVSWEDCQDFIKKLNAKTAGGYRLPTEAEWEYACRAGTTTAFAVGNSLSKSDANIDGDSIKTVGSYKANAFGLYDLHGNVWEWCEDWRADYPAGAITDPKGPATGEHRVLRGGSFFNSVVSLSRSSNQFGLTPTERDFNYGFRLVRTVPSVLTEPIHLKPIGFSLEVPETGALVVEELTGALKPPFESEQKASKSERASSSDAFSNHKFADSFFNLGDTLYDQKKDAKTLAENTYIIQPDPEDATIYNSRGESYSAQQRHSEAIADFTKAIELNPKNSTTYNSRGDAYFELKKYPEAIADYTKSIELDPNHVSAFNNRGSTYSELKKYPEAIADFTKSIELNPKDVLTYNARGMVYTHIRKYPEAIADYTKSIELDPKHMDALYTYYMRGHAYKALGKTKEAIADFAKAKELEK